MSFGLTGAPHTFQKAMNSSLEPLLRKCVLVFFDDIPVYSKSYQDHVVHLEQVFQLLQKHQWRVKPSKCSFAQREISYLGFLVSEQGVATCPSKVQAVVAWHSPKSVKELRSFLGLARYYRKIVKHFGVISRPLKDLLKKYIVFVWIEDHEKVFQTLKQALTTAPVLALPYFDKPFYIETDASEFGVGAVLMQSNHPLAYVSKALWPKLRGLSTYEKENVAILLVVDHWKPYLQFQEFCIATDYKSLFHLNDQRLYTS
jgi:hypothetical protein